MATDPYELLKLEKNWDRENSDPPDRYAIEIAANIGAALSPLLGTAYYVPTPPGVQVEWHEGGWDVEVWINPATVSA